jgi:hypothetical protein
MRRAPRTFGLFAFALILSPALSGCGESFSRTEVTGRVMYNGKPITRTGGSIAFLGADGIPHPADIDGEGNYHAAGICLGENKVTVFYTSVPAPTTPRKRVPGMVRQPAMPNATPESVYLLPSTYAVPETSGLNVVVEKHMVYNPELTGPEIK